MANGVHVLRYEQLLDEPEQHLRAVLDFIALTHATDQHIRRAVDFASFDALHEKEREGYFRTDILRPRDKDDPDSYKTRKGGVGTHRDEMTPDDIARADRTIAELGCPFYPAPTTAR